MNSSFDLIYILNSNLRHVHLLVLTPSLTSQIILTLNVSFYIHDFQVFFNFEFGAYFSLIQI